MSSKIKILAFAGSAREGSFNKKLVKIAADGASQNEADVTLLDLRDYPIALFDEDLEKKEGLPLNAKKIKEMMISNDGLLIATPEYNSSITPLLKNTLDWVSRAESKEESPLLAYKNKVAAIMSASPGGLGGLRGLVHIRSILENMGVIVLPNQRAIGGAYSAFDEDGTLKDAKQQESIVELGKELVGLVEKLKS